MTQVAADTLGLPIERVRFELGDTDLPMAPVHGGSITMASVGNAVRAACQAVRAKLTTLAGGVEAEDRARAASRRRAGSGSRRRRKRSRATSRRRVLQFGVRRGVRRGPRRSRRSAPYACPASSARTTPAGIVNPKTARSQCIGGMVQGVGMALLEQAEWDRVMAA